PAGRGGDLHLAAGYDRAQHRLLACAARRGDARDRARPSARHRRHAPRAPRAEGGRLRNVLEVANLAKSFGGVEAGRRARVGGASFGVAAGELVAMIGPNGAGKTTCFNMLNGQLAPDSGSVKLEGAEIGGLRAREVWRRGVGRTFQITATFASMTVRENVQM